MAEPARLCAGLSTGELDDLLHARETSYARVAAFKDANTPALRDREDRLVVGLARENSSGKSKLRKVYQLLAELGSAAQPFVACRVGCSACCKMNLSITSL